MIDSDRGVDHGLEMNDKFKLMRRGFKVDITTF
jgi:hypothetical protein